MKQVISRLVLISSFSTLVACAGQGMGTTLSPRSVSPTARDPVPVANDHSADSITWLRSDSSAKKVELSLEVTRPPGASSALLNGYRAGEVRVVVPLGWTVSWNWRNTDSTAPHSLVLMVQREKMPLEGGRPSFTNAMTRMVLEGLPEGQTDQTAFVAEEAGWYWLLCGVPEHALTGEWIELQVSPEASVASASVRTRAAWKSDREQTEVADRTGAHR
jgi:hypothetical protein